MSDLSLNVLSGELGYRIAGGRSIASTEPEFRQFLASDCESNPQAEQFELQTNMLSILRDAFRKCQQSQLAHEGIALMATLDATVQSQLSLFECERRRVLRDLQNIQQWADAELITEIQRYFALVREELLSARMKLNAETVECEMKRRQATILRDIRIFAHHLHHETRGNVSVTLLPKDSSQFKRCKKAVKDNVSRQFMVDRGYRKVRVLAVMKIENSFISSNLQRLATNIDNGKVKGLFCVVPKGGLHALCAFGLHQQSSETNLKETTTVSFENLFQVPWFRGGTDGATVGNQDSLRTRYSAEAMVLDSLQSLTMQCSSQTHQGDTKIWTNPAMQYTFSRQCTLSSLQRFSEKELEEGVFISLCRVLVSKVRTISSLPTPQDLMDAIEGDFDAVYTTRNDEYVLLKPEFVLPEFAMMICFSKQSDEDGPTVNHDNHNRHLQSEKFWVPRTLYVSAESEPVKNRTFPNIIHATSPSPSPGEVLMSNAAQVQNSITQHSSGILPLHGGSDFDYTVDTGNSPLNAAPPRSPRSIHSVKQEVIANIRLIIRNSSDQSRLLVAKSFTS